MKNSLSRGFKCLKCFLIFYLVFTCMLGLGVGVFASYLLIFREGGRVPKPKNIVLYFLILPTILTLSSTALAWRAIKIKNIRLLKFFAVLLAATAIVEISGSIWCFISLPEVNEEVKLHMKMKFDNITTVNSNKVWWYNLQTKLECCGLHGPVDYHSANSIPFSCCGSDPKDRTMGSCTFLWQKGCSDEIEKQINNDLILISLIAFSTAILYVPGVFSFCCFAQVLKSHCNKAILQNKLTETTA